MLHFRLNTDFHRMSNRHNFTLISEGITNLNNLIFPSE